MSTTISTAPASEAAPARSPARIILAGRFAAREVEAAIPAMNLIEPCVPEAFADFHRAIAAVGAVTRPVVVEEIDHLVKQIREATAALVPLLQRLSGARTYA